MADAEPRLRLGLDLADGRLRVADRAVPLTPTLFSMLRYFVLNPNRLITKQELLDQVWPDTHVTEALVKDYVRKIRRLLGDDAKRPRFLETARGMGYRYIGDIEVSGLGNARRAPAPARESVPSIAVLAFVNASGDGAERYFSDGIAEDIIAQLSRFRSLVVIARDSSFRYGARPAAMDRVGRDLGVRYVVEGSVRKAGDNLRIHVRLIEAASGVHLWAERYDRAFRHIFTVQDEIVGTIASRLVGGLEDHRRRHFDRAADHELVAYDYVLRGDHYLNRREMNHVLSAREMYRTALDLDPASARAYAGMALSFVEELWSDWTTAAQPAAEQSIALAKKAVSLDPLDSRARVALAAAYHFAEADFQRAEIHYDKALELNPNDYWGYCLKGWLFALSGETERARACLAEAIRLSPVDTYDCRIAQFLSAYSARRYDEALSALGSIAEPTNLVNALLAMCYGQLGRDTEAGRAMADYLARARDEIVDYPGADRDLWRSYWGRIFPFKDDADLDHLLEGFLETAFH